MNRAHLLLITLLALALALPATASAATGTTAATLAAALGGEALTKPPRKRRRRKKRKKKTKAKEPEAPKADAKPSAPPADSGGGSLRRSNRMEFDARLIQGQTPKAGAVYLFQRAPRRLPPLVKLKPSYLDRVVEPVLGKTEMERARAQTSGEPAKASSKGTSTIPRAKKARRPDTKKRKGRRGRRGRRR